MQENPLQQLKDIEEQFAVEDIEVNALKLWPYLRVYIGQQISTRTDSSKKAEASLLGSFLKNMFYGFTSLFKRYETLILAPSNLRKINGKEYVDRVDVIAQEYPNALILELPVPTHRPRSSVPVKHISSRYFIHFLEFIYSKLFVNLKDLKGAEILNEIEAEHKTNINAIYKIKRFVSQYKVMKYWMKKWNPKRMFIIAPYNNCAYMKVAHEMNVEIIELQHGVINESHYGYNVFKNIDSSYYPDRLWTYGSREESVFHSNNYYIQKSAVKALGSYHLDLVNKSEHVGTELQAIKSKGLKIVAISSQETIQSEMIDFISSVASLQKETSFLFIPRYPEQFIRPSSFPPNVYVLKQENIYTMIREADVHATAYSTTAIEAPALGTPNIMIDIKGYASKYYGEVLNDTSITVFVDTPELFVKALDAKWPMSSEIQTKSSNLFRPDFMSNLQEELKTVEDK